MFGTVFCTEPECLMVYDTVDRNEVRRRNTDHDIAVMLVSFKCIVDVCGKLHSFFEDSVHFPVACDNVFSHC